jgi:hypothetical protein
VHVHHTGASVAAIAAHSSWTRRRPTANESSKKLNPASPNRWRSSATSSATDAALRYLNRRPVTSFEQNVHAAGQPRLDRIPAGGNTPPGIGRASYQR